MKRTSNFKNDDLALKWRNLVGKLYLKVVLFLMVRHWGNIPQDSQNAPVLKKILKLILKVVLFWGWENSKTQFSLRRIIKDWCWRSSSSKWQDTFWAYGLHNFVQRTPDKLAPLNILVTSFIEKSVPWNFYCLCAMSLWIVCRNFTFLWHMLFVWQAFFLKK